MTITDFRQYVGLQETEYTEFAELNRWTISKPVKLINESIISDISVRVEFQRKGRKVEGLYFKIEPKQQTISVGALTHMAGMPHPAFAEARITIPLSEQYAYLENYSADLIQATIERANLFADDKLAKGESVNLGAIYKSAFSGKWGVQYLEQKQLQTKSQVKQKEPTPTKRKVSAKPSELAQDKKLKILEQWQALSDDLKSEYFKRAINNLPKAIKSLEVNKATLANVMDRPLLRIEIEKLFGTV